MIFSGKNENRLSFDKVKADYFEKVAGGYFFDSPGTSRYDNKLELGLLSQFRLLADLVEYYYYSKIKMRHGIIKANGFRLYRMHEMQTVVTDVRGVCLSVCLSRGSTRLYCAKTDKRIKMLFGVNTPGSPWNIVLDMGLNPPPPDREGEKEFGKMLPIMDPLYVLEIA